MHALTTFLDLDNNGLIERSEFLRQLAKAEQIMAQSNIILKQSAVSRVQRREQNNFFQKTYQGQDDEFEVEEIGGGDQAFETTAKPVTAPKTSSVDEKKKKSIVESLERSGAPIKAFIDGLKKVNSNGLVPLGTVLKGLETNFPKLSQTERTFLIKDYIRDRTKIDLLGFETLFAKYSSTLVSSPTQAFRQMADSIISKMGGSSQELVKQFFRAQGLSESDMVSEIEFK